MILIGRKTMINGQHMVKVKRQIFYLQSVLSLEEQKSTGDCAITNVVNDNISQFVDRTTHAAEQLWILSEKMTREKSN